MARTIVAAMLLGLLATIASVAPAGGDATQSVEDVRSHAKRGSEY